MYCISHTHWKCVLVHRRRWRVRMHAMCAQPAVAHCIVPIACVVQQALQARRVVYKQKRNYTIYTKRKARWMWQQTHRHIHFSILKASKTRAGSSYKEHFAASQRTEQAAQYIQHVCTEQQKNAFGVGLVCSCDMVFEVQTRHIHWSIRNKALKAFSCCFCCCCWAHLRSLLDIQRPVLNLCNQICVWQCGIVLQRIVHLGCRKWCVLWLGFAHDISVELFAHERSHKVISKATFDIG